MKRGKRKGRKAGGRESGREGEMKGKREEGKRKWAGRQERKQEARGREEGRKEGGRKGGREDGRESEREREGRGGGDLNSARTSLPPPTRMGHDVYLPGPPPPPRHQTLCTGPSPSQIRSVHGRTHRPGRAGPGRVGPGPSRHAVYDARPKACGGLCPCVAAPCRHAGPGRAGPGRAGMCLNALLRKAYTYAGKWA